MTAVQIAFCVLLLLPVRCFSQSVTASYKSSPQPATTRKSNGGIDKSSPRPPTTRKSLTGVEAQEVTVNEEIGKNLIVPENDDSLRDLLNLAGAEDNVGKLRICDKTKIAALVRFSAFPKCPDFNDVDDTDMYEVGGRMFRFKPNMIAIKQKIIKCYRIVSTRYLDRDAWGQVMDSFGYKQTDVKEPIDQAECERMQRTKKGKVELKVEKMTSYWCGWGTSYGNDIDEYRKLTRKEVVAGNNGAVYGTDLDTDGRNCMYNRVKTTIINHFMEEVEITSQSPYDSFLTPTGLVPTKIRKVFIKQTGVTAHDGVYVWNKIQFPKLCDYILDQIHNNTIKQSMKSNKEHHFFIMPDEKKNYVVRKNSMMNDVLNKNNDHLYCISAILANYTGVELYPVDSGLILGYVPSSIEVEDLHQAIVNGTGDKLRRSLHMKDRREGEDDTLPTPEEMKDSGTIGNRKKREVYDAMRQRVLLQNAAWMIGDQDLRAELRYFVSTAITNWTNSLVQKDFERWCREAKDKHIQMKEAAREKPSETLTRYFGRDVSAVPLGDIYQIHQCRYLQKGDFSIVPSLEPPEELNANWVYNRPLVSVFNPKYNRYDLGQILPNQEVVFPPVLRKTLIGKEDKQPFRYFIVNNEMYVFYLNQLVYGTGMNNSFISEKLLKKVDMNDTKTQQVVKSLLRANIIELNIKSSDVEQILPFIDNKVSPYKPPYDIDELEDMLTVEDALMMNNRYKESVAAMEKYIASISGKVLNSGPDINQIMGGIVSGLGEVIKGVGKAIFGLGDFLKSIFNWFVENFHHFIVQLLILIMSIVIIIGGIYGFFACLLTMKSMGMRSVTAYRSYRSPSPYRTPVQTVGMGNNPTTVTYPGVTGAANDPGAAASYAQFEIEVEKQRQKQQQKVRKRQNLMSKLGKSIKSLGRKDNGMPQIHEEKAFLLKSDKDTENVLWSR